MPHPKMLQAPLRRPALCALPRARLERPRRATGPPRPRPLLSEDASPENAPSPVPETSSMRLDAIKIGKNPPDDVNVVIEVPIGGEAHQDEKAQEAGRAGRGG